MNQPQEPQWGKDTSVWLDTTPATGYPQLDGAEGIDVAIAGGGIAGLITAYLLVQQGMKVAVIDTGRIVRDVTGYTTGKLTIQHGLIFRTLIDTMGEDIAQVYADANTAGFERIVAITEQNGFDCDFKRTESYVYTAEEQNQDSIEAEVEACHRLGIEAVFTEETPLGYSRAAVRVDAQAQWHPRKFLLYLADQITAAGSYIFENTRATDIVPGTRPLLDTDAGKLRADKIVVATNLPFFRQAVFNNIFTQTRSYVLGVKLKGEVPPGLYYSIDPTTPSMRSQPVDDGTIFMVGTHKRELQIFETEEQYRHTENFARSHFDIASIDYHWYTMDQTTPDRMPLVGRMTGEENIFLAAGFSGWGMTTSGMTGILLSDLIAGRDNPWAPVFDPARLMKG